MPLASDTTSWIWFYTLEIWKQNNKIRKYSASSKVFVIKKVRHKIIKIKIMRFVIERTQNNIIIYK